MEVFYLNNKGQKISFTQNPYILLNGPTIFDYSMGYTTSGRTDAQIKSFTNQMKSGNLEVIVTGKTREEYCENFNRLVNVINSDVDQITAGKLYCGDQYCKGYFCKITHGTTYNNSKRAELKLGFVAENGNWIYEDKKSFSIVTGEKYNSDGLDFPTDYPFDYANDLVSQRIVNDNYASSDFEMIVYGPCISPEVSIGLHTYKVDASLYIGEYMVIDSRTKKVYKVKNNGEKVNLFHARGRDFYIFEKIPSGIMTVAWSGEFGFDITLLSERSEPVWT